MSSGRFRVVLCTIYDVRVGQKSFVNARLNRVRCLRPVRFATRHHGLIYIAVIGASLPDSYAIFYAKHFFLQQLDLVRERLVLNSEILHEHALHVIFFRAAIQRDQ